MKLPATPARVRAALTEPAEQRTTVDIAMAPAGSEGLE